VNCRAGQNLVHNPGFLTSGTLPDGWSFSSPSDGIAPDSALNRENGEVVSLVARATGDRYAFGCWRGSANLTLGKWYVASVRARVRNVTDPALSILATVAKHFLVPKQQDGDGILLEQVFKHGADSDGNNIELFLRASETGQVEWFDPCVMEISEPQFRKTRVATVRFGDACSLSLQQQRSRVIEKLDQAGALNPDIVVLTETTPIVGVQDNDSMATWSGAAETVPDGPICRVLSGAAERYAMYVTAGIIERRGEYLFNTAVLFDRKGNFVGQYDKTHLTFGELCFGISCGSDYPVFDLDCGRIGIHICYDEWFPEVARYYAYKGVEILFLLVAGGKPITWRTRALDNGIYFVSSSVTPPSMIIDSSGEIIAETHGDGIAFADLNLDYRRTNAYGDPTLAYGMPCIVPQMRNVIDDRLLEELAKIMKC